MCIERGRFGGLTNLRKLYMQECEALLEVPPRLKNLCAFEELDFLGCWVFEGNIGRI